MMVERIYFQKIRGIDINGLCDSYCKVTIVPQMGKVGSKITNQQQRTDKCLEFINGNSFRFRSRYWNVVPIKGDIFRWQFLDIAW